MICPKCHCAFKDPDRVKGGKVSKRVLTTEQARKMNEARAKAQVAAKVKKAKT